MYCRVNEGNALQCKLSVHSFHCLPDCRSLFSVKDVIIYDLGMDCLQNHLVGTVSLSGD